MTKTSIELKVGESISFDGERIKVSLVHKSGNRSRLAVVADDSVTIKHNKDSSASAVAKGGLPKLM